MALLFADRDIDRWRPALAAAGLMFEAAASGAAVVNAVQAGGVELVVIDGDDGFREPMVLAVRRFGPAVKLIVLASSPPDVPWMEQVGVDGWVTRSWGEEALVAAVKGALRSASPGPSAANEQTELLLDTVLQLSRQPSRLAIMQVALDAACRLVNADEGLVVTVNEGAFLSEEVDNHLVQWCGRGSQATDGPVAPPPRIAPLLEEATSADFPHVHPNGHMVVPFRAESGDCGALILASETLGQQVVPAALLLARQLARELDNLALQDCSQLDLLTGTSNRRRGVRQLREAMLLGSRYATPTSVLLLDLDRFSWINGRFGRSAGDRLLRGIVSRLRDVLRETDYAVRWGDDEFLLVLSGTAEDAAVRVARRARIAIENGVLEFNGERIRTTASIGVASAPPGAVLEAELQGVKPGVLCEQLVESARLALRDAKDLGRNRVVLAETWDVPERRRA